MWIVFTFFFLAILALLAYLDTKKPKNFPPGPKWLPILGSAWAVHKLRQKTGTLCKATGLLAEKYGPVIGLRVGKDRTVVVYGCEAIREFLSNDQLGGRPQGPFYEIRTWGKRRGVMLTDEDFWHEQRRFVLRQLREFGFGGKNMSSMIEDEAECLIQNIKSKIQASKGPCEVRMDDLFGIHVLNTLWTMMAGTRYSPEDKELKTLQKVLKELFANIDMVGTLFSHFPFLRHIAPEFSGYNLYLKAHQGIWKLINSELQRHKLTYNAEDRDFMDVYLKILNSPGKKDSFTEIQLSSICLDLFMAGSETTSKSLGFAFLSLLRNPDVQRKAQEEIDRVVGRERLPSLIDRPKMQYTECVVLESLRTFAGRSFSLPHRALADTKLQGYFIPKDTMVIANFEGILVGDDSGWAQPEAFIPERFIKDGRILTPDSYLPFGFGRRRCMGETLAKANVFLIVSSLLQNFNFTVPPGYTPPSMDAVDGATPAPQPFKAIVSLRPL